MRVFFMILVCALFKDSLTDNAGNCDITDISAGDWQGLKQFSIKDDQVSVAIFESKYTGTLEVGTCTATSENGNINNLTKVGTYFKFTKDEDTNTLQLFTTDDFGNVDADAYTNGLALLLVIQCTFTCSSTSTLGIMISVEDTNTHPPTFLKSSYEYKVPIPIMPKTDFTVYGDIVEATDLDFSNTNIQFTINPEHFTISSIQTGSKTFKAVFSAINTLQLTETTAYELTATDAGSPTRSSSTTLNLVVDSEASLDSPTFVSNSYKFKYSVDTDGKGTLETDEDSITAKTNRPTQITDVNLHGDYKAYFAVTTTSSEDEVTFAISVEDVLPSDADSIIVLTLSFRTDALASTTLLVYTSSGSNENAPQFGSPYYKGSYDSTKNTVTLDSDITVTSASTTIPQVTVTGEHSDYFTVSCNSALSCELQVSTIPTEVLSANTQLFLTMKVTDDGGTTYSLSVLIITLPTHLLPVFSKLYYTAKYSVSDASATVELEDEIEIENVEPTSMKIDFETYSHNFHIVYDESSKWTISVDTPLSKDVLNSYSQLIITLTATCNSNTSITAQSVLAMKLPGDKLLEAPKFSQSYYVGKYEISDDNTPSITMTDAIQITNKDDMSAVKISLDSYETNLKIVWKSESNQWNVDISERLDDNTLQFYSELRITLTAEETSNDNTGSSVLILTLPKKSDDTSYDVPMFSQIHYAAKYLITNKLNINYKIDVKCNESVTVSFLSSTYSDNFDVEDKGDNYYVVTVKTPLPSEVLKKETTIILTLAAQSSNAAGYATFVIILPKSTNLPSFSQVYYVVEYLITNILETNDTISVTYDGTDVSVNIENSEYSENFAVVKEADHYKINVATPLSSEVLENEISVVITLVAEANSISGYSTMVINLPIKVNSTSVISFGSVLYSVAYDPESDDETVATLGVSIDADDDDVQITLSDELGLANTYFKAKYSKNQILVSLKDELPDLVVKNNSFIALKLTVAIKGTTDTNSVVVNVRIVGGGTNGSSLNTTGYIAAISVLAALLIAIIAGFIVLWYLKLRTRKYSQMEDSPKPHVKFSKNLNRQSSDLNPPSAIEARRPTGFIFAPTGLDADIDDAENADSTSDFNTENKETRKSVAFDPNVEKIHIEPTNDGDGDSISNNEYTSDTEDNLEPASEDQLDNGVTEATNIPDVVRSENGNLNHL